MTRIRFVVALAVTLGCGNGSTGGFLSGDDEADAQGPEHDSSVAAMRDATSASPPDAAGHDGASSGHDASGGHDAAHPADAGHDAPGPTEDVHVPDVVVVHHDGSSPQIAVVYGQSAGVLYSVNPDTDTVTTVGFFFGCDSDVIDIALDKNSTMYATTFGGVYTINTSTAACTLLASGTTYPNSLSFVPAGTVDPNVEALVGYQGATYVRIDTTSGAMTTIGSLGTTYTSSGDIVSVIGGGTFLTVNGNGCGDCLLQVDPTTGDLVQNYGAVGYADVWGLAFWAGTAYGFDEAGDVFSINVTAGAVVSKPIPVPNAPAGLSFYGAGSTTSAPPTAPDGGGIPIIPPK